MSQTELPPQPPDSAWGFVESLAAPLWSRLPWRRRLPTQAEADLRAGLWVHCGLADPDGLLQSTLTDLAAFAAAGGWPFPGPYRLELVPADLPEEGFCATVSGTGCSIGVGDLEGARRALFWVEEAMLRAGGPFLPLGVHQRVPWLRRRISRCFFGPIKRPPRRRDELLDDQDYYPPHYLNRLAHEGINGLWLTVEFREMCRTRLMPHHGEQAERRLAKLRRTVEACRRYGLRTYLFCIEPRAWSAADATVLPRYPELTRGGTGWDGQPLFCPFSAIAESYLREAVGGLFGAVPHLGGLITISHGERPTTCLSALAATGEGHIRCPVCAAKAPWEVLAATLGPMEQALHAVAPAADLISWLYMPQPQGPVRPDLAPWVYDIPAHVPPGVILQFNFESGVRRQVFGKELVGGDYWLSNPGPSDRFSRVAAAARAAGTPVSAKIQTGCSHEVATIPFVPIPGAVYRKFAAMRHLGVSASMLCWYFGNYPGVMNQAAGRLAFEPFPASEAAFLRDLAQPEWGEDADRVAQAWSEMAAGYEHYPLTNLFQYYGPMHDGPVWPLHLVPQDAPLAPTWLLASPATGEPWPPSGDRVGEAFGECLSLDEVVTLCQRVVNGWDRGAATLSAVGARWQHDPARLLDIGLAQALAVQFGSGYRILRFYQLREQLLRGDGDGRRDLLDEMEGLIRAEMEAGRRLLQLCAADARLGFHSEAEGYKYYPERIRWRLAQLERVLAEELPKVRACVDRGELLYPEYTGRRPTGAVARQRPWREVEALWHDPGAALPADGALCFCREGDVDPDAYETAWCACRRPDALYVAFRCRQPEAAIADTSMAAEPFAVAGWRGRPALAVRLEPRRLWPCLWFAVSAGGGCSESVAGRVEARVAASAPSWQGVLRIPSALLGWRWTEADPLRLDVQRSVPGQGILSWQAQHPVPYRLCLGNENPADLGWLLAASASA